MQSGRRVPADKRSTHFPVKGNAFSNMSNHTIEITAIDFRKLLKEERQRMRKELKSHQPNNNDKQQQYWKNTDDAPTSVSTNEALDEEKVENTASIVTSPRTESSSTLDSIESSHAEKHTSVTADDTGSIPNPLHFDFCSETFHTEGSMLQMAIENPYIHNVEAFPPTLLNNVFYSQHFLSEEFVQVLLDRIRQLHHNPPYYASRIRKPQHEQHIYGHWTRLQHAQRNVALFDLRRSPSCQHSSMDSSSGLILLLGRICQLLVDLQIFPPSFPPNHILMNEYQSHEGIMPHTDGPSYYSKTATISIGGGDVLLKFTSRHPLSAENEEIQVSHTEPVMEIKLSGKGSLIVFQNEAYMDYCHSIQDRLMDDFEIVNGSINTLTCINFHPDVCNSHDEVKEVSDQLQMKVIRGYRVSLTFRHKFDEESVGINNKLRL